MKNHNYLYLVLILIVLSCSSNSGLTKSEAFKLLKKEETEKSLQNTRVLCYGNYEYRNINSKHTTEINTLKQQEAEGVINLNLVSEKRKFGSKTLKLSSYNVSLKPEHEQYVVKKSQNEVTVKMFTVKVKSILSIDYESSKLIKALVEYEKVNTPFYKEELIENSTLKNKGDVFTKEIIFIKDNNKWEIVSEKSNYKILIKTSFNYK